MSWSERTAGTPQLLGRAFALLGLFDEDRPSWTATEAARETGLPLPTVHRLLVALVHEGYLHRHPAKRFSLGPAALRLGQRAAAVLSIEKLARPLLADLAAVTDEVAMLFEPSSRGNGAVCRARFEGSEPFAFSAKPGREMPLHAGASPKALLAFLSPQIVDEVCRGELHAVERATITQPDRLRRDLEKVRRQGWAISFEETDCGVWGIALPIVDRQGTAVAAVGLAGPRRRLDVARVRHELVALNETAVSVADRLGYGVPELELRGSRHRRDPGPSLSDALAAS